ncbi:hypothetical protein [Scytonema sp. PRP1]|uniref:hypothetical protein n=1 Tax=Scytonema sp. PRP1 TaxID=3120513 RepID=UPI002FD13EE4
MPAARQGRTGMPMANATAIAVRAASPKEIRHATRKPAARFALTPVACGGDSTYGGRPAVGNCRWKPYQERWTHMQRLYIDLFITVAHQLRDTESFCHALILVPFYSDTVVAPTAIT